ADRDAGRRIASRTQRWGDRPVCATVSKRRPVTEQVVNPNSNRSLELSPERAGAGDQFFALRRAAGWLQQLHRLGSQDAGLARCDPPERVGVVFVAGERNVPLIISRRTNVAKAMRAAEVRGAVAMQNLGEHVGLRLGDAPPRAEEGTSFAGTLPHPDGVEP